MRDYNGRVLPKAQCASCLYYPKDCGYWASNDNDNWTGEKLKVHNCQDYEIDPTKFILKD